ncbi:MAG: DUF4393 domain-containing protein [Prevotella sp.]|nr:DUF4393 domain-containing protein [Prevotella sp.]
MGDQLLDTLKSAPNLLGQLYDDLMQPSVRAMGIALGSVLQLVTCPFAYFQTGSDIVRRNAQKMFDQYAKKIDEIPEDKRMEVDPEIGVPIVNKLLYTTHEEIADLFTSLLANASNIDMVHTVHPYCVEMIARLSVDEARIIKSLKWKTHIEYCDFRANDKSGKGFNTIKNHITLIPQEIHLDYPNNINAYFANLVSMAVLQDMDDLYKIDQKVYDKIKETYKYEELRIDAESKGYKDLTVKEGYYNITDFGKLFINACVKD